MNPKKTSCFLAVAALSLAMATPTWAASDDWVVDAAGNWDGVANWLSGTQYPDGLGDVATLGGASAVSITASRIISVNVPVTLGGLKFDNRGMSGFVPNNQEFASSGYRLDLTSNSITLDTGTAGPGDMVVLSLPTSNLTGHLITNTTSAGKLVLVDDLNVDTSTSTPGNLRDGRVEFAMGTAGGANRGCLDGAGNLIKSGPGQLQLNGDSDTYTGTIYILQGQVQTRGINNAGSDIGKNAFGTGSIWLTNGLVTSGSFDGAGMGMNNYKYNNVSFSNALVLDQTHATRNFEINGIAMNYVWAGNISSTTTLDANLNFSTYGRTSNMATLTGDNSGLTMTVGRKLLTSEYLGAGSANAFGAGNALAVELLTNSAYQSGCLAVTPTTIASPITVQNTGNVAAGVLGGTIPGGTATFTGAITLNSNSSAGVREAFLRSETGGTIIFDSTIGNGASNGNRAPVTKVGGGGIELNGNNTYLGDTTIRSGAVILGDDNGLGAATSDVSLGEATTMTTVRLATTGYENINTWAADSFTGASTTVDGVALVAGDRILVKDSLTPSRNGIYVVQATTSTWTRATDMDESSELSRGMQVAVTAGIINGGRVYFQAQGGVLTLNTTSLDWHQDVANPDAVLLLESGVTQARNIAVVDNGSTGDSILGSVANSNTEFSGDITLDRDLSLISEAIGSNRTTFSGVIDDLTNTCGITKGGAGRVELSGANEYDGGTLVSSGTLIIGNSAGSATGSGPVTVMVGSTLTGSGAISGTVTVLGTIRPGSSSAIGTLATGPAVIDGTCQISLDGATTSLLTVAGDLTLTGTCALAVDPLTAPSALTYTVITYSGTRIGSFGGVTPGYELIYDDANQRVILRWLETYIVTFQAAPHGLVNGAGTITYGVFEGDNCPPATAQPDPGYVFAGWTGDFVGMDNPLTLVNILKDTNVDANFAQSTTLSIEVTPVLGGTTIPAPGDVTVGVGVPVLIQAFANSTYGFDHWEVLSGNATLGASHHPTTTVTVNDGGGATVRAIFGTGATLTMATSDPGLGGTMPPPGVYTRAMGSPIPIEALPNMGILFTGWQATANASVTDVNALSTTVTLSGDATVTATFAIPDPTLLTLGADPLAGGVTIPAAGTYTVGVSLPFVIGSEPNPGYAFAGWEVISGNATLGNADLMTTTVTIADTSGAYVIANFAPAAVLTMVADPPIGGGTMPAPGPNTVAQGVAVYIGAMPAAGYLFIDWTASANALLTDAGAVTTTATLSGDATITANFAAAVELTMVAATGGSTTPAPGTYTIAEGVAQAIVATPNEGYHFVEWLASLNASLGDANAASTTATLAGDAAITPVFEINTYTVVFQTDGTAGALVNGAVAVTYTVAHGSDCTPVTAEPPPGQDFTGWSGDYVGVDNPLTLTNIVADMTVTASFGKWVAQGLVIELDADDVDGLATPGTFFRRPKFYALYHDPVKDPDQLLKEKKATLKVLTKIDKAIGQPVLDCEWTKKIKLYSSKNFKAAQKAGTDAAAWLAADGNQADLALDLHTSTKESDPVDQSVYGSSLAAPEILTVTESVDIELGTLLTIEGTWFGTKRPKVWREYVDAKGAIKQQKYKVLKAADPAILDSKEKMAYMNRDTGVSKVIVVVPTKIPVGLNGILVLDNGVGMATDVDPTVTP